MTSRWLKDDDGKFVTGKNGKKLPTWCSVELEEINY